VQYSPTHTAVCDRQQVDKVSSRQYSGLSGTTPSCKLKVVIDSCAQQLV
jgi:hypothetical protein